MKLRFWSVAAALSLTSLLIPVTSARAASADWPPPCAGASICFWSEDAFSGHTWEWTSRSGYRDMPAFLHDHVGSFVATTRACFINWDPVQKRNVYSGDWRSSYLEDFGGVIDGVGPGAC
ncbi:hypothetical protein [Kitasatospora kifunensis]|uniref:Peptidase inhibitor family I36 n=1 Tax=Kitasatospora kifunensis TaxID=58351 RepID=A0A7W7R581_KITKI|nr:hypothetical protein [Kitasatospora kifunensis]MBB4925403.1 hypothetical protein [Kitasatospora kifunensis]